MKDIIDILNEHRDVAFATVNEQGSPKVRIFQIMELNEKELYFSTAINKEVYVQLKENPKVELVSWHENISIRVAGTAKFDVSEDMQKHIFETSKILQDIYHTANNPNLTYFRLIIEWAELFDLNHIPPKREFFEKNIE